jgi:hypothetical protein
LEGFWTTSVQTHPWCIQNQQANIYELQMNIFKIICVMLCMKFNMMKYLLIVTELDKTKTFFNAELYGAVFVDVNIVKHG